jgi:dipeptidyl aminopeptidase/acylaminoacyl peptidase
MKASRFFLAGLVALLVPAAVFAAGKRPMTVDDLFRFKRVSEPQISPDGKLVAYVVGTVDLEGNRITSNIWLAPTDGKGEPRPLTNAPGKKDRHPRWSPNGKRILFESNRSGSNQLWVIDLQGGEAQQLTKISTEASSGIWSPDGNRIACVSAVYPEYSQKPFKESDALNKKRIEEAEKSPVKAKVFTKLFYRHWDSYVEDKRQHLFIIPYFNGESGEPRDVTPGDRDAYPTSMTFETGDNYTFSPDGDYLVFTAVPEKDEAWSTNYDICRVPVTGGTTKWECLTRDNPAADSGPVFSPDGKKLAYRAQKKPGNEADRWQLMVVDTDPNGHFQGKPRSVTPDFDSWVEEYVWSAHGKELFFTAQEKAATSILLVSAETGRLDRPSTRTEKLGTWSSLSIARTQNRLAFLRARLQAPAEVDVDNPDNRFPLRRGLPPGSAEPALPPPNGAFPEQSVSRANEVMLGHLDLPSTESVVIKGAGDTPMQIWILKPPGFDPKKKWPLVYLVHGGPQAAWDDGWSFRWNPQLWAAQGYVVALPNPRGSTGFGQKYVEEITGDWGGKCYEDLMKGAEYLEKLPYIDRERMAAAGASFGGYMMNWFAVNTGRFKTLITHCSVWNFESMYGTTDELWFDENEHGGPPWGKNRHSYEKHSPHRLAANLGKFKTPMLIIHNDLDFRCPIGQGHELFSALKRQGVESRFINFPDEGHWVLKPKNSQRWHNEVFTWLKKHVPPGGK